MAGNARLAKFVLLTCTALSLGRALADPNASKSAITYRWTDAQGVVHYGDHVPPEYATQESTKLNNQGVEVGHQEAQQTPEQQAAAERARAAIAKQQQHDTFLITTYTSVKDIEALRDVRLDELRGQRAAAAQYVDSLRSRLGTLQTRALAYAPYSTRAAAPRMPDDLAENLVRALNEWRVQENALAANGAQEQALRAQFDADIQRYRELHTIHSH
jgi:hypothetical protein